MKNSKLVIIVSFLGLLLLILGARWNQEQSRLVLADITPPVFSADLVNFGFFQYNIDELEVVLKQLENFTGTPGEYQALKIIKDGLKVDIAKNIKKVSTPHLLESINKLDLLISEKTELKAAEIGIDAIDDIIENLLNEFTTRPASEQEAAKRVLDARRAAEVTADQAVAARRVADLAIEEAVGTGRLARRAVKQPVVSSAARGASRGFGRLPLGTIGRGCVKVLGKAAAIITPIEFFDVLADLSPAENIRIDLQAAITKCEGGYAATAGLGTRFDVRTDIIFGGTSLPPEIEVIDNLTQLAVECPHIYNKLMSSKFELVFYESYGTTVNGRYKSLLSYLPVKLDASEKAIEKGRKNQLCRQSGGRLVPLRDAGSYMCVCGKGRGAYSYEPKSLECHLND